MRESRFQIDIATGRFTLPVAIFLCLILWGITRNEWSDLGSLACVALTGYLMIETNTAFNLIRTRTTFHLTVYFLLATALVFLHPFEWGNLMPILFMIIISQLFKSYESSVAAVPVYHAFLFTGLGSLIFPQLVYYLPLFMGSMFSFRAISLKSLLAALLGLLTPYWFLFGYTFYFDQMSVFYEPLKEIIHLYPINYGAIPLYEWISWGFITLLSMTSGVHYLFVAYQDKTRTRIYLTFLVVAVVWTILFGILQPQHLHDLMHIHIVLTAILTGHLFSLTRNRFSSICFIVTFVMFILLTFYNIWMQYFSF